jgi:hypothetical protein
MITNDCRQCTEAGVFRFESCVYSFIRGCVTVVPDMRSMSTAHSSAQGVVSDTGGLRDHEASMKFAPASYQQSRKPQLSQTGAEQSQTGAEQLISAYRPTPVVSAWTDSAPRRSGFTPKVLPNGLPSLEESPQRGAGAVSPQRGAAAAETDAALDDALMAGAMAGAKGQPEEWGLSGDALCQGQNDAEDSVERDSAVDDARQNGHQPEWETDAVECRTCKTAYLASALHF